MFKRLLLTVILAGFVPLPIIAEEEQNSANIFQQYNQEVVKPHDYSYDYDFMNFPMFPFWGRGFGYGGYYRYSGHHRNHNHHDSDYYNYYGGQGHTYYGPDFWNGNSNNSEFYLKDLPDNTYVDPNTYNFQFQEKK